MIGKVAFKSVKAERELYEVCPRCDGSGRIGRTPHDETCPDCEGYKFLAIGMTVDDVERLRDRVDMAERERHTQ